MAEEEEVFYDHRPACVTCGHPYMAHVDAWSEEYFGCKFDGCWCHRYVEPETPLLEKIARLYYGSR